MQVCPWTPWHVSVYMCVPVCMHVCAHVCTRLQTPSRNPSVPPDRGSSQLSGYGSAGPPGPPPPCKHLAGLGPQDPGAPRLMPTGIQRGGGFQGTKLTLARGSPLLVGPPRAQPPQHGAHPEASRRGTGAAPHLPASLTRPGLLWALPEARPPPSQDGLDSGNRARWGWDPGAPARHQVEGLRALRPHPPAQTLTLQTTPMVLKPSSRPRPAQREAAILNLYSFIVPRDSLPCIIRL